MTGTCKCGCGQPTMVATSTTGHDVAGQPRDYVRGHRTAHLYATTLEGFPDWTTPYVAAFTSHIDGTPGARRLMRSILTDNAPQTGNIDYF